MTMDAQTRIGISLPLKKSCVHGPTHYGSECIVPFLECNQTDFGLFRYPAERFRMECGNGLKASRHQNIYVLYRHMKKSSGPAQWI